jgi:hypothetical protein
MAADRQRRDSGSPVMSRRHTQRLSRAAIAVGTAVGALAAFAPTAYADAPTRVGWWNMVSATSIAAPAPATPSGGMHVAAGPGQVLAYGAVLYTLPSAVTFGQLTLAVAGSQGTVKLLACPTKSDRWKGGDDQPAADAPAYDCRTTSVPGTVATDGKSVSFPLSALKAGSLSLAIVPDTSGAGAPAGGLNQPFSVDLGKPGESSLDTTSSSSQAAPPPPTQSPPSATAPASTPKAASSAGRPLAVPNLPPPSTTQTTPSDAGVAPQVAAGAPPATSAVAPQPVAASDSGRKTAGTVIGGLAIVAAFMFWGLGRGLLGGRIAPLSIPTRSSQA